MAEKYSFFNSVVDSTGHYDREYLAEDYAAYFASFIGNGVYANPATSLMVSTNGGMGIKIASGKAWINGYFYSNDEVKTFELGLAEGATERIDRVVVRLDLVKRLITTDVKKGVFAATAVAPELTRTGSTYELALADIKINKNAVEITPSDITDLRMNTSLCGVVSGVVDQIDTEGLFARYDYEFNEWFKTIQDTLSGDVAGKLQAQIGSLPILTTENKTDLVHAVNEVDTQLKDLKHEVVSTFRVPLDVSKWSSLPPYTQEAICDVKSTDQPIIALRISTDSADSVKGENKAWGCIDKAETQDGKIVFTCYSKKPETSIILNVKGSY